MTPRRLRSICTLVVLSGAGATNAQEARPTEPPAIETPKAPPELDAALKGMIGVWRCEGKLVVKGQELKTKTTYTFSPELDGFWYVGRAEAPRTKDFPPFRSRELYGFDPTAKVFTLTSIDNLGGFGTLTSTGWSGDRMEWSGRSRMFGQEREVKQSITRKGDREFVVSGKHGDGLGTTFWETDCKK